MPAAAGPVEGDADDNDLELVVANLREQRDKVRNLDVSNLTAGRMMSGCNSSCQSTAAINSVPEAYP